MRLPSLKFLKTFSVAARRASFKEAADELCITPSAVSHQIRVLEENLGVALFERGTRSLVLTDAGVHYLAHVDEIFTRLESVTDQLRVSFGRRLIRLHVPSFFASEVLLPQLAGFSQQHGHTDIRIETSWDGSARTHPSEADLSVVVGSGPWDGLLAHTLFPQSFIAVCAPTYLLDHPIDKPEHLNGLTQLVQEDRRNAWERWAERLGAAAPRPGRIVRFDTTASVARAAEEGLGVALLPARLSAERLQRGTLVQLFTDEWVSNESYVLLQRPDDAKRAELQEFTRWISSICR